MSLQESKSKNVTAVTTRIVRLKMTPLEKKIVKLHLKI